MKNLFFMALSVVLVVGCSTSSDVSTGDLKAPFTENKAQIESCYEKVAKKQPDLGNGTVELKFLIDENGKAYKTIFMKKKSTLSNKLLNACLKKVVHGWQFPTGKSIEVIYPFQFEKATTSISTDSPSAKTATGVSSDATEKQSDLDVIDTSPKEDETSGDEEDEEGF
jgi:hypothetical protein